MKPSFKKVIEHTQNGQARPMIVELGNVGCGFPTERKSEMLIRSAKRHPTWTHVGIDLESFSSRGHKNLHQIKADFLSGLESLENGTASMIVSRLSLGYYTERGNQLPLLPSKELLNAAHYPPYQAIRRDILQYTERVLELCCQKLRTTGWIFIEACTATQAIITTAAKNCNVIRDTQVEPIRHYKSRSVSSFWSRKIADEHMLFSVRLKLKRGS